MTRRAELVVMLVSMIGVFLSGMALGVALTR